MGLAPPELQDLLRASTPEARDDAWARFAARFTPLLLHTARAALRDHDRTMDAYTFVLEQLRADESRRLRAYAEDPRSEFTTWLVVVVRRLCLDHQRQRYGRVRSTRSGDADDLVRRRRLVDLITEQLDDSPVPDSADTAETRLRRDYQTEALRECLAELSPSQRLLLALRFEDDRSVRDIAALLGYPTPFHVYRAINAALAALRRALARKGVSDPEP